MTHLSYLERALLLKLVDGLKWKRSFHGVKPVLKSLEARRLVLPCKPPQGKARNMVFLSRAGFRALGLNDNASREARFAEVLAAGGHIHEAFTKLGAPMDDTAWRILDRIELDLGVAQ